MIIMFIFLFLTVAFVIGTAIYLNRKKKNVSANLKQDSKNDTKEKSKKGHSRRNRCTPWRCHR